MNLSQVARVLAGFTLFFSLVQGIPLMFALFLDGAPNANAADVDAVRGFVRGMAIGLGAAALLWVAGRRADGHFFRKEGLIVVGMAWLMSSLLGAIPFLSSAAMPTAADAIFESVSGLTTTGATVLGAPGQHKISELPHSLLLWRSMLQWMGGLGIILVFIVLLPAMGVTGKNLLSSEQVGVSSDSLRPRMQEQARGLFRVYLVLTLLALAAYWAITGSFFESVCHAFTTLSTGGFSPRDASIGEYDSVALEIAVVVFMFLAGANFTLLLATSRQRLFNPLVLLKNPEFRLYAALTVLLVLVVTAILIGSGKTLTYSLRQGTFAVVSLMTSTGYGAAADFQKWPGPALSVLLLCMLIGGSSGSTAGGIKTVRLLVVGKVIAYQLRHFIRPKSVEKIRVGHDVVPTAIVGSVLAMTVLWVGAVSVGTLALSLDGRLHLLDCFSANLSMCGCTGPALSAVDPQGHLVGEIDLGPMGSFGALRGWSKILLSLQMVFGRLEFLVPLAMLTPGFWKR